MLPSPRDQRPTGRSMSRRAPRNCQTAALEPQPPTGQGQLSHHQGRCHQRHNPELVGGESRINKHLVINIL